MNHKAASRFNEKYKYDKCPQCNDFNQTFILVSDGQLGCRKCGAVFIATFVRDDFNEHVLDILKSQEEDRSSWSCECGFNAKTKAGLVAHKRACDKETKKSA